MEKLRNIALVIACVTASSLPSMTYASTLSAKPEQTSALSADSSEVGFSIRGTARRGERAYLTMFRHWPRTAVADRVFFSATYPTSAEMPAHRKAAVGDTHGTMSAGFQIPADPNHPVGPSIIGRKMVTDSCGMVTSGGAFEWATIEYHYEYRFTRDANRDGKMDSDPRWVLVGATWTYFNPESAQICQ